MERIQAFMQDRDVDTLLTSLISDLHDLSDSRMDALQILNRMFTRLNSDEDGNPLPEQQDTRPTSEAFDTMGPIAVAIDDLAKLIWILRGQVFVYTATGPNLDDLGRDYDFPRLMQTQAIRQGETFNNLTPMQLADFPIGSWFIAPGTGDPPLAFILETTEGGQALFRSETYGSRGNAFYGDLIGVNVNGLGRAIITDSHGPYIPGQDTETDEEYRRRFLRFLRRRAFGGNVP